MPVNFKYICTFIVLAIHQSNCTTLFLESPISNSLLYSAQKSLGPPILALDLKLLVISAWKDIISSGFSGALAGALQVILMMWLRTTIHYQHRHGVSTIEAIKQLYEEGGIPRFYTGVTFALMQAPLARFGSVAANTGADRISSAITQDTRLHVLLTTLLGTVFASVWRVLLMPVDTCKTVMQVQGSAGLGQLIGSVSKGHVGVLFQGTLATMAAAAVAHYSWFIVYNWFEYILSPTASSMPTVIQNALLGFVASAFSDIVSNPIRVIKTMKQSLSVDANVHYVDIIRQVVEKDGVFSLFGRGLLTRILSNGLQSMIFTVLWKTFAPRKRIKKGKVAVL